MPRIRLLVIEETPALPYRFRDPADPDAGIQQISVLRLGALARIEARPGTQGKAYNAFTALIDTGAWISALETKAWQDLEAVGLLERLQFDGPDARSAAVGGKPSDYRLGRIWVSLFELRRGRPSRSLPPVPVIVQLLLNPDCRLPYPLVLGLHLGILDGRKLTRRVVPPNPSPLSTDRGPQYGQDWHLETT